jgi:6-phosphogluconate dehydrogenase
MVHNGIEYGLMAAYAEGLNLLRRADVGLARRTVDAETSPLKSPEHFAYELDLAAIAEVWRHGSVIRCHRSSRWSRGDLGSWRRD